MEYHIIHAFTPSLFGGNPAGVCLPASFPPENVMQKIATENNLSETAFLVKQENGNYRLRWFTPTEEVDLCGHATLSSAYVLFGEREKDAHTLKFDTLSGELTVTKSGELLCLDFPCAQPVGCPAYPSIGKAFGIEPLEVYKSIDFLVVVKDEKTLRGITPDFDVLMEVKAEAGLDHNRFGFIVTTPGDNCDFVSRYFAPHLGVPEDPVTGRAHCTLTPYWSKRLGKKLMDARQLSARGGVLLCEDCGPRVKISGRAVRYLKGSISYE